MNFTVPVSWSQLTQEQLRRVFDLLVVHEDMTVVKTILLVEFCGLTVERKTRFGWKCQTTVDGKERIVYLKTWEIQDFIGQLEYISQLEDMDNRLDVVCGLHAADPLIRHGVSFEEYLYAEKYYHLNSATLLSIKLFKYLSNKKLPRILPCRRIHLS